MCGDDAAEVPVLGDGIDPSACGAWAFGKAQRLDDWHDNEPAANPREGHRISKVLWGEI